MADQAVIERDVIAARRTCYHPEIPVDIYELGLIYGLTVAPDGVVHVRMTLTSPNCKMSEAASFCPDRPPAGIMAAP